MTTSFIFFSLFIMAQANETTSPAPNPVRPPTPEERRQLADWLLNTGAYEQDDAVSIAEHAYVAVFDTYCTDCPGYAGKVMAVVWGGASSMFDVFTWKDGTLERSGREYDEKACDRCGATGGTLCWTCWRRYSDWLQKRTGRAA